jgi:hypothetical protein
MAPAGLPQSAPRQSPDLCRAALSIQKHCRRGSPDQEKAMPSGTAVPVHCFVR